MKIIILTIFVMFALFVLTYLTLAYIIVGIIMLFIGVIIQDRPMVKKSVMLLVLGIIATIIWYFIKSYDLSIYHTLHLDYNTLNIQPK